MSGELEVCYGCGALGPRVEGKSHDCVGASPGCRSVYGEILEREYADYERYFDLQKLLTMDSLRRPASW